MAFNLGAFAGGLAKGGMDTYLTLENIESQKKRDALVELQTQEAKAAGEERAALKNAASSTYGQVGAPETALPGRKLSEEEALNAYAIDQGAASAIPPKAYTQAQADADYLAKVRSINPERALDVEGKQTQTAIGKSSLARIKAEDDFATWHQEQQKQAATDPVGFLKSNLGAYNNAKKGSHLDDGYTASVVDSADGKSASFVRTDAKGKVIDSTPIDANTAGLALKHIAFDKYSALPGKFKESVELENATRNSKSQETSAAASMKHADAAISSAGAAWANARTNQEQAKAKNDYWAAAAKKMGQTKADDMKETVAVQADLIQKADPSIPRAQAELQAANKLLHSAGDKASVITGEQVQKFLDSPEGDKLKFKLEGGKKVPRTPEERQAEALRILRMRQAPVGGIPTGGNSDAAAILNQAIKNATDEDFRN
jgi:hypothetical protein